jgi:hypothetical protein
LEVLLVASLSPQALGSGAKASVQVLEAWAGPGFEPWSEKTLKGKKPKRVSTDGEGQPESIANGFVRGTRLRSR